MKFLIKTLKASAVFILAIIALAGIYFLLALILSGISVKPEPAGNDVSIFLLTNGVHTDLVLPVKSAQTDWSRKVPFDNTADKDTTMRYLAFGWGNKKFYLETPTWADLKFSTAFQAAFGLGRSAIHTTYFRYMDDDKDCIRIGLSRKQYKNLTEYIDRSFIKDSAGNYLHIQTSANYGSTDAFYDAKGRYNLFYTCNTWTNNGLKACGQKACLWTPFQRGIFKLYRRDK